MNIKKTEEGYSSVFLRARRKIRLKISSVFKFSSLNLSQIHINPEWLPEAYRMD